MNRIILLLFLVTSGCVMIPENARSRSHLLDVVPPGAPMRSAVKVGERDVIISRLGYAFPDDSLVIEIDRLVRNRRKYSSWPGPSSIVTKDGSKWGAEVVDDYLVLSHAFGSTPLFDMLFISPVGLIGVRSDQSPKLDKLEPLMRSLESSLAQPSSRLPYIYIPKSN